MSDQLLGVGERYFVPCAANTDGTATLLVKPMQAGPYALLVYSSPEALAISCGQQQLWAELSAEQVETALAESKAEYVVVDLDLTADFAEIEQQAKDEGSWS